MYLARYDPNLREIDLCELNRSALTRAKVIPASLAPVKSVVPDTLTLPLKLSGLVFVVSKCFSSVALCCTLSSRGRSGECWHFEGDRVGWKLFVQGLSASGASIDDSLMVCIEVVQHSLLYESALVNNGRYWEFCCGFSRSGLTGVAPRSVAFSNLRYY